jgi:hypothetical protein
MKKKVHIDEHSPTAQTDLSKLNQLLASSSHAPPIFILIFMTGCGPCEATIPEWKKIKEPSDESVIVAVNMVHLDKLPNLKFNPDGFPTILYIHNGKIEQYEGNDRTVDSFMKWIQGKESEIGRGRGMKKSLKGGKIRAGAGKRRTVRRRRRTVRRRRR